LKNITKTDRFGARNNPYADVSQITTNQTEQNKDGKWGNGGRPRREGLDCWGLQKPLEWSNWRERGGWKEGEGGGDSGIAVGAEGVSGTTNKKKKREKQF